MTLAAPICLPTNIFIAASIRWNFRWCYLKYAAQLRAALAREPERPFKIVPILVSSFHSSVLQQTLPERDHAVQKFLSALRDLTQKETRRVCFIAGVDLAHVGSEFGDREPVTEDFLKWVEREDHKLIERLGALDAPGFFNEVAKDGDRRKICGFAPLYSLIHLLDGAKRKSSEVQPGFHAGDRLRGDFYQHDF